MMTDLSVMEAAADWLVRLNDAPEDEALVTAWLQWCEASPENLAAFNRAQTIWRARFRRCRSPTLAKRLPA